MTVKEAVVARFTEVLKERKEFDLKVGRKYAGTLIGAGGTMNREAAILQTPVISCYPGDTLSVDQFYVNNGLMYRTTDLEDRVTETENKIDVIEYNKSINESDWWCKDELLDSCFSSYYYCCYY